MEVLAPELQLAVTRGLELHQLGAQAVDDSLTLAGGLRLPTDGAGGLLGRGFGAVVAVDVVHQAPHHVAQQGQDQEGHKDPCQNNGTSKHHFRRPPFFNFFYIYRCSAPTSNNFRKDICDIHLPYLRGDSAVFKWTLLLYHIIIFFATIYVDKLSFYFHFRIIKPFLQSTNSGELGDVHQKFGGLGDVHQKFKSLIVENFQNL